jgi:hypothetical protein
MVLDGMQKEHGLIGWQMFDRGGMEVFGSNGAVEGDNPSDSLLLECVDVPWRETGAGATSEDVRDDPVEKFVGGDGWFWRGRSSKEIS